MKTITFDSMTRLDKSIYRNKILQNNPRPNFEKLRAEKTSIPLSKLFDKLKENIFYCNFDGGYIDTKENILQIYKTYNLKVVYWDYIRMLAFVETKEENCLNCKDAFWCATYQAYKKVIKCNMWRIYDDTTR